MPELRPRKPTFTVEIPVKKQVPQKQIKAPSQANSPAPAPSPPKATLPAAAPAPSPSLNPLKRRVSVLLASSLSTDDLSDLDKIATASRSPKLPRATVTPTRPGANLGAAPTPESAARWRQKTAEDAETIQILKRELKSQTAAADADKCALARDLAHARDKAARLEDKLNKVTAEVAEAKRRWQEEVSVSMNERGQHRTYQRDLEDSAKHLRDRLAAQKAEHDALNARRDVQFQKQRDRIARRAEELERVSAALQEAEARALVAEFQDGRRVTGDVSEALVARWRRGIEVLRAAQSAELQKAGEWLLRGEY